MWWIFSKYSNMKHAEVYCYFCKTSDFTLYDSAHGEVFCEKCGFVFQEKRNQRTCIVEGWEQQLQRIQLKKNKL